MAKVKVKKDVDGTFRILLGKQTILADIPREKNALMMAEAMQERIVKGIYQK